MGIMIKLASMTIRNADKKREERGKKEGRKSLTRKMLFNS